MLPPALLFIGSLLGVVLSVVVIAMALVHVFDNLDLMSKMDKLGQTVLFGFTDSGSGSPWRVFTEAQVTNLIDVLRHVASTAAAS